MKFRQIPVGGIESSDYVAILHAGLIQDEPQCDALPLTVAGYSTASAEISIRELDLNQSSMQSSDMNRTVELDHATERG